jgi:hypothetical protein
VGEETNNQTGILLNIKMSKPRIFLPDLPIFFIRNWFITRSRRQLLLKYLRGTERLNLGLDRLIIGPQQAGRSDDLPAAAPDKKQ